MTQTGAVNLAVKFFQQAARQGEADLFFVRESNGWAATSYSDAAQKIRNLAAGLIRLGLNKGDRVLLCAENSPWWGICDLAIMAAGGIVVPAYTTHTKSDQSFTLRHSGAVFIIAGSGICESHLREVAGTGKSLKAFLTIGAAEQTNRPLSVPRLSVQDLCAKETGMKALNTRLGQTGGDDLCCIIYTSGTGGRPKGVMLSHRSIQANIDAARDLLAEGGAEQNAVFLSLLPLSHAYEHTAGLHLPLQAGAQIYYCEGPDRVAANLAEVRPTLMTAVPRLYEVLHERIERGVRAKGGLSAFLFHAAVRLGRKRLSGGRLSGAEAVFDRLLDYLVRAKVRQRFGGRLRYFISGGAPLSSEVGTFFLALGINILQGYGQTEASPLISANRPHDIRITTVGPAVRGVEVRLAADGELLVRGACVMSGYWRNRAASAAALRGGWLHTGDLAAIDDDGFITVTGRKKDMIVTSGGDNVAPSRLEAMLVMCPEISQAMVFGDKRPFLSAILVPGEELISLNKEAQTHALKQSMAKINKQLASFEKIRKFIIADESFSIENQQMTPTLKVRRQVVLADYQARIEALYR